MNFKSSRAYLVAMTVMVMLSACIKSDRPQDIDGLDTFNNGQKSALMGFEQAEQNATFNISGDPKVTKVELKTFTDGATKDVAAVAYRFEVCLSDRASDKRALSQFKFNIKSPSGEVPGVSIIEKSADDRSCLIWSEKFSFDVGKNNPKPVLFLRKISASDQSTRKGEVSFIFRLFPWAEVLKNQAYPATYYIRHGERKKFRGQIQKLYSGAYNPYKFLKLEDGEEAQLYVKNVRYNLTALPFSVIKKDSQPSKEELLTIVETDKSNPTRIGNIEMLKSSSNFVMQPEKDNPRIHDILPKYNISPYKSEEFVDEKSFDGLKVNLVLNIRLSQPYAVVNGTDNREKLSGRFKVLPYLYAEDFNGKGDRVHLNPEMLPIVSEINEKGDLNVVYPGILPFAPTSGRVNLALQIIPMDNNVSQYETVEELFVVGDYDELIGVKSRLGEHPANFDGKFNFKKHAKESKGYDDAILNSHLRKAEPYNYSLAEVRFKTIEAGETANRRTVIFNVKTCVNAINFNTKILEGQEYEVWARHFKTADAEKEDEMASNENRKANLVSGKDYKDVKLFGELGNDKIRTTSRGCLNFIDKIRHKYYQTERLMRRRYFIRAKNDVQDFTKELVLYFNPWDEKFGTLGTDSRAVSQTFLTNLNNRKKIVPRFYIQDFKYETLRFRYEVDKNMNLIVKKTVLFRTQPRVMRYSNVLQGINSIFPIRDGIYLMKVAYQKDYLDPAAKGLSIRSEAFRPGKSPDQNLDGDIVKTTKPLIQYSNDDRSGTPEAEKKNIAEYNKANFIDEPGYDPVITPYDPGKKTAISIVKKLVRVNSGAIITPVEFSVEDLRLLRIRGQVFVQIEPVNQTRLQIVNMASREIEKAINLKIGEASDISKLSKERQREIISQKLKALDTLAGAVPDDIEYTKDDASELYSVFEKEEVIKAFRPFLNGGELGSVAHMLKELDPALGFSGSEYDEALDFTKKLNEKLYEQVKGVQTDSVLDASKRNYNLSTVKTEAGQNVNIKDYKNSDEFYERCGPSFKGYDQCVAENTEKNADFNPVLCKCFDNISKDYRAFENKRYGAMVSRLENEINALKENKALMSSASIVSKVRTSSKEFFGKLTSEDALTKLLLNDFTVAQAESDISDLNLLKDKVIPGVDIDKRTFVGPLTFLNNTNGGALRPTDNLDEAYCVTDDCNSLGRNPLDKYSAIQNFDYERSPYHGSIAHFAGKNVDDFIDGTMLNLGKDKKGEVLSYKKFNENKKKEYKVKSLLSNFVNEFNLSYVSLKDKKLKAFICTDPKNADFEKNENGCLQDYNKTHMSKKDLMGTYAEFSTDSSITGFDSDFESKDYDYAASLDFLKTVVKKDHGGKQCTKKVVPASYADFNEEEYSKFCSLMTYGVFAKNYKKASMDFIEKVKNEKIEYKRKASFMGDVLGMNSLDPFTRDYSPNIKLFVDKVYKSCLKFAAKGKFNEPLDIERKYRIEETGRYYYLGGKSLNITLGQSIGVSHKEDSNKVHKMDASAVTRFIPQALKGYGYSYSKGEGISANQALTVQQGTFLVMQNAEFDVELKKYEQCLVVRWSDFFLKENKETFYYNPMTQRARDQKISFDGELYEDTLTRLLTEGLMICSGDVENTPVAVRETYYYFTQHFTEGDMQDRADIHNHPWLLSLRGVREFETFLVSTLSDHDVADKLPESRYVQAEELVGMRKLMESDFAAENLNGTSYAPFDKLKRNTWPLTQLIRTYRKISPTFPGLYTQLDRSEYEVKQWPWAGSVPGEKFDSTMGINCYTESKEKAE